MDAFVVRANGPLSGTVRVRGATKNAGLKQMAAALLAPGVTVLRNLHPVLDLDAMLDVMHAMGAELEIVHGLIEARCQTLCGTRIVLDFPSVGATENLLTAAVMAKGQTVLDNAAREPEISDLAAFLNGMGAQISGAGSSTIEVDGVESLTPIENEVMGDRIEAGTILMACGVAGGEVTVEGTRLDHLEMVVLKLGEMGLDVSPTPDGLTARCDERLHAVDVATLPYPGFAPDFMPLVVALLATAEG